ncbi:MAG TPA: hypothetical protein VGB85_25815 [Nannocystis sp.]
MALGFFVRMLGRAAILGSLLEAGCGDPPPEPDDSGGVTTVSKGGPAPPKGVSTATPPAGDEGSGAPCSRWSDWNCAPTPYGNACEATCDEYIIDCNNEYGLCNWAHIGDAILDSCEYTENAFDGCEGCEHGIKECQPF